MREMYTVHVDVFVVSICLCAASQPKEGKVYFLGLSFCVVDEALSDLSDWLSSTPPTVV